MQIKEVIEDLKKFIKRRQRQKDADMESEGQQDSPNQESFASGNTGPIPGIKRNWVKGIAIFIVLVFVVAFMYGADETAKSGKTGPDIKQDSMLADADRQSRQNTQQTGADSYESLIAKDREKAEAERSRKQREQQQRNQQQQSSQNDGNVQAQRNTPSLPSPSYSVPYVLPSQQQAPAQAQPAPAVSAAPAAPAAPAMSPEPQKKDERDIYGAAIAFGNYDQSLAMMQNGNSAQTGAGNGQAVSPITAQGVSYTPLAPRTISAGTIIPAMLLTGINTDSPGQIMAQVQSDVYDFEGYELLIPAGAKLMGKLDSANAQNGRVGLTFSTVMMPDGGSWNIGDTFIAIDGAGYTGIKGKVDKHTDSVWTNGFLSAGIAALGSLATGNTSSRDTYSAGQIAAQGALANMISATSNMMSSGMANSQFTVSVEPGCQFSIYVTKNISF